MMSFLFQMMNLLSKEPSILTEKELWFTKGCLIMMCRLHIYFLMYPQDIAIWSRYLLWIYIMSSLDLFSFVIKWSLWSNSIIIEWHLMNKFDYIIIVWCFVARFDRVTFYG